MYSTVLSASIRGISGCMVTVEADVSDGLPSFSLVGFLASETREASERVRTALRNSGVRLSPEHVTVNLAPASIHKEGSLFDLAIAAALMGGYGFFPQKALDGILFLGEMNLNGEIGPVRGILELVSHAAQFGCDTVIIPERNLAEGSVVKNVRVLGARNFSQVIRFLAERSGGKQFPIEGSFYDPPPPDLPPLREESVNISSIRARQQSQAEVDFSQIRGQALLRRAAEIAVSGFHNLLMIGPPGAGKSLTAKCISTILPETSLEEALEVTKIHSVAGVLPENAGLLTLRPFRAPHHTITPAAMCGGGNPVLPGEVSLSHRGILYLDEMPEFDRQTLETLRGPLEDGNIRISRMSGTYTFPAKFMLVASMNPCRCGYFPDRSKCSCRPVDIRRYLTKISMPLLDRIDMGVEAGKVNYEDLTSSAEAESSASIRARVTKAVKIQKERYLHVPWEFNGELPAGSLETFCPLSPDSERLLRSVYDKLSLTARSYCKLLRVARTIADLDGSEKIQTGHLAEAVSFRSVSKKYWEDALSK